MDVERAVADKAEEMLSDVVEEFEDEIHDALVDLVRSEVENLR